MKCFYEKWLESRGRPLRELMVGKEMTAKNVPNPYKIGYLTLLASKF